MRPYSLTSDKINRTREHLPDDSAGQAFHQDAELGAITCSGDLSAYLRLASTLAGIFRHSSHLQGLLGARVPGR